MQGRVRQDNEFNFLITLEGDNFFVVRFSDATRYASRIYMYQ